MMSRSGSTPCRLPWLSIDCKWGPFVLVHVFIRLGFGWIEWIEFSKCSLYWGWYGSNILILPHLLKNISMIMIQTINTSTTMVTSSARTNMVPLVSDVSTLILSPIETRYLRLSANDKSWFVQSLLSPSMINYINWKINWIP